MTFQEEEGQEGPENLSTMMEPSCKWLVNREESCWDNFKSFKSIKLSMRLLALDEELPVEEDVPVLRSRASVTSMFQG